MVVGFVNSGLMSLKQAINVIMGANIGTTVMAWILSLGGISSDNIFVQLLKPTSFTPVLALMGIILYMFCRNDKKKDIGTVLLGFAVLMFGMDAMTGAVSGLADVPQFRQMFVMFKNPILGVLVGAVLTAVIQSSSASVGILQALAATGAVSYGAAIPIIMGQNIGTCITAILSSFGTNRNAKRAALVHLSFNVIGTAVWLTVFSMVSVTVNPAVFDGAATLSGIAVVHSAFNIACTAILLPMSSFLEKLAYTLVPEAKSAEKVTELDERLLATPAVALQCCHAVTLEMAEAALRAIKAAIRSLTENSAKVADEIREAEERTDHYEDIIGSYLVELSAKQISSEHSEEAAKLLHVIGDYERIADHSVNLLESAEEMKEKNISLSKTAMEELKTLCDAVEEILELSSEAFTKSSLEAAYKVEPLEQTIDYLKEKLRANHIARLQQGQCSIEAGFVWSDILTNLERTSDHCSNIAGCVIDLYRNDLNIHEALRTIKKEDFFKLRLNEYIEKYKI